MGLGIAFMPSYSRLELFSDNIALKSVGVTQTIYAYIPKGRYVKRAVTAFIDTLMEKTKDAR